VESEQGTADEWTLEGDLNEGNFQ